MIARVTFTLTQADADRLVELLQHARPVSLDPLHRRTWGADRKRIVDKLIEQGAKQ